jgi:Domain of unknown function (DUF4332)
MTDIKNIPGIGKASQELLEAAGFADAEALSKAGVDELVKELERANSILQIAKRAPVRGNVEKWIVSAREITGVSNEEPRPVEMPVNYEASPQAATMLAIAPFAIPLPAKFLIEQGLLVSDVPPAILLNRYCGDLEIRVEDRVPVLKRTRPAELTNGNVKIGEFNPNRRDIDVSRIKPTDALAGAPARSASVTQTVNQDRVALIRGPKPETNRGRNPESRFFIRGVMHSHPVSMAIGAVTTLLLMAMLPIGIVSAALLLLSQELPKHFEWVPTWLLVFPLSLPILGIMYLVWGLGGSCRICGQKIFVPRMCLKNSKAHHRTGLGYIVPVCLHMLLFKWFRCTYCGTPVRLKK